MLTDKEKEDTLNNYLAVIRNVTDVESQKRVWIWGKVPECDSYDEMRHRRIISL